MSPTLEDIVQELNKSRSEPTTIPQSRVEEWMRSELVDPDTVGAIYVFLSKDEHVRRVSPPLSFDPVFDFLIRYYEFCLKSDPQSKWANDSYSAGLDLVGFFVSIWDEKRERRYFTAIKSMLERLYSNGGAQLKMCIERAIVKHLFERKEIRRFFDDWRNREELRPAYEAAMSWVEGGGTSPLTDRRQR